MEGLRRQGRRREPGHDLPRHLLERSQGARRGRPDQIARREKPPGRARARQVGQDVIRREGDSLILEGAVTLDTVPGLIGAAEEHLRQGGARVVDFSNVTEVDSAAVALAIECLRKASESQTG
ncbi:MAG: STAS domain-containing protein [Betaproteobacteria bacterium]|nr:MAG: STAS domain-containing protein [Betaproteobacteria bacterium]